MVSQVVVIGAGVYGAAVAAELSRRGAGVTIVDSGAPASGTSRATFSWINSCGKQPRAYHDLNVAGMAAHRRLAARITGADWYHGGGNLEWADGEVERAALRRKVEAVRETGYEAQWLTRAHVLRLEPEIRSAALPDGDIAYFPAEGWLEPVRLIGHLLSVAGAHRVWHDAVTGFDMSDGLVRAVRLASGRLLRADAVVNCAGPRAADIAGFAGLELPMRNTPGVLVYTTPVPVSVSRVIHAPRVHLRPDGGGRLLLHTHDLDHAARLAGEGEFTVDGHAAEELIAAAAALYPGIAAASVESVRVGVRPIPGDGLPVLGRARAVPNFHFAVSHSGATLALVAGALVAAEALGVDRDEELADFRFERF
ncbi:NAD(P)/FAD-dependent oxidoreductase [Nocardia bovistercoris]|uniref:FAD-binding oxidoreductase n=1 Tax=Nocardia bovistercoris TaxID=2785916 RepID=A0A931IFQ8_9NOCA|nr:FAD-dependent oxidoreductase [Nocardia bovistercoris]MBH0779237.1 FAD-binding oxidoreductase [Nocardia bovistercoris]